MTVAIRRKELDAGEPRREAGRCRDARAARRVLASAPVPEGRSREEAARHACTDRQTLRDRAHRHDAEGLAGPRDRWRPGPGPPPTPEREARAAGGGGAGAGPGPRRRGAPAAGRPRGPGRGPPRRRAARALGRRGAAPARRRPAAGPPEPPEGRGGGAGRLPASFPELVKAALPPEAAGEPVGVRFRDEARVGRRGTLARSWARRGTRPRAPRDRRCARACLFGAARPARALGPHRHRRRPAQRALPGPIMPSSSRAAGPAPLRDAGARASGGAPSWRRFGRAAPLPGPGRVDRGPAYVRRLEAAPRALRPALPAARPGRAGVRCAQVLDDRETPALAARRRPGRGPRPCARGARAAQLGPQGDRMNGW